MISRWLRIRIGALLCIAAVVIVAPANASAATTLGGVSVAKYCQVNVYSGNIFAASKAVNINNRWDGWRCAKINGQLVGVDMNLACRQQYPKSWWQRDAYAGRVGNGMYDWRCYR